MYCRECAAEVCAIIIDNDSILLLNWNVKSEKGPVTWLASHNSGETNGLDLNGPLRRTGRLHRKVYI